MQIRYDSEADVLLLVLRDTPPVDAVEEPGGVIISYGEDGEPVSVEFLNASVRQLVQAGQMNVTLQASNP
jgi:uncharacterized protein YuzE